MMRTIQQRYYVPNNSVLVVTGDVKASEVFAEADSLYAKWARTEDPFKKYPLVKHPPLPKSEAVVVVQPVKRYTGAMIWHGPSSVGDSVAATYAADLFHIVETRASSKFQTHLVGSGACLSADLGYAMQRNTGQITLNFEAAPGKVDTCVKAIASELPQMKEPDYLTDQDLQSAANLIDINWIKKRERLSEYAHRLTFIWASAGIDHYFSQHYNLQNVNREAVAKYLDTYVIGKKFVFGSMVSPEMSKGGFDKAHFEALIGLFPPPKPAANANANPSGGGAR
jgi:zinc protease